MDRPELLAFFEKRGIQTRHIPLVVLEHARQVVERIEAGQPYWKLRGKRMHYDRCRISIPVGRRPALSLSKGGVCWPLTWTA